MRKVIVIDTEDKQRIVEVLRELRSEHPYLFNSAVPLMNDRRLNPLFNVVQSIVDDAAKLISLRD